MKRVSYAVTVFFLLLTAFGRADQAPVLKKKKFYSASKTHLLKIEPRSDSASKPGHCRTTLFRGSKEVWSRHLINNYAPGRIFVTESGKYVLTMDEWGSVGELPVVVYGQRGNLIRVHSTDSLGLKDDIVHIGERSVSNYWWNRDSVSFFGPDEEMFFIRLHWGKWIVLELRNGQLLQKEKKFYTDEHRKEHEHKWKKLEEYRQKKLVEHAVRMLSSIDADERKIGALISGQEKLRQAVPKLRKLLADRAWFTQHIGDKATIQLYVRQTAQNALEAMGESVGKVITKLPEKGHIRYDESVERYVLDFDEEEPKEDSATPIDLLPND